ncbi:RING-H2 finger protein ATL39-like [Diospyros lotus]|uniref:RING-H2 finger protein ATL39-like n=1 Tax=Diospyros lotus TaxID=55363 RepID=UPI00224EA567|nr:RING-H2 finger protein ATL39-like [Diospyros lotus]
MDDDGYNVGGVSPLVAAIIGSVATLSVLLLYHCLRTRWHDRQEFLIQLPLRQPRRRPPAADTAAIVDEDSMRRMQASISELIPTYRYSKDVGELSKTQDKTCTVCLCEFTDDEPVRILPDCSHAFHVPCIDMWLFSHGNCPVCRTPLGSRRPESDRLEPPSSEIRQPEELV